jgi:hypothetical protein
MRRDLYGMFYPLEKSEQDEWAEIVRLPSEEYLSRLAALFPIVDYLTDI